MLAGFFAPHGDGGTPTPPASILATDPYYAKNTVLLLGNGSNGGTQIVDQIGNVWTLVGNTQTDGSGAIVFDGTGDYAYCTRPNAIGTGDFSVELKFRVGSLASDCELVAVSSETHSLSEFNLVMETKTSGAVRCSIQTGSGGGVNVDITSASSLIAINTDYTLSFDVTGTAARIRLDGAVVGTGTITGTRANGRTQVRVGALSPVAGFPRYLNGKVHWLRITAGQVRNAGAGTVTPQSDPPPSIPAPVYTSRFTLPTFGDVQGVCTDGTHVWVSSSTTIYKYTTAGSLVTSRDVSGDDPSSNDQINGMFLKDGVLYVVAANFTGGGGEFAETWVVEYDPDTLAYIDDHAISGDWFGEGIDFKDGYWWITFHAHKTMAQVDPSDWSVVTTHTLTFPITGTSGGYGGTQGYDSGTWHGYYVYCNIHETYNEDFVDVYYWNGTSFDEICRLGRPSTKSTQGICTDPTDANALWFCERGLSGAGDSLAKMTLT